MSWLPAAAAVVHQTRETDGDTSERSCQLYPASQRCFRVHRLRARKDCRGHRPWWAECSRCTTDVHWQACRSFRSIVRIRLAVAIVLLALAVSAA